MFWYRRCVTFRRSDRVSHVLFHHTWSYQVTEVDMRNPHRHRPAEQRPRPAFRSGGPEGIHTYLLEKVRVIRQQEAG